MATHPSSPPSSPQSPHAALIDLLAQLRQVHRAFVLARLGWLLLVAALATPLGALLIVVLGGSPLWGATVVRAGLALAALGLITRAAAPVLANRPPRSSGRPADLAPEARRLQRLVPTLGSSVTAALAGAHGPVAPGSLMDAHIRATLSAARAADPVRGLMALRRARLRPWRRACVRLVLVALGAAALARPSVVQLGQALRHVTPTQLSVDPLWADVQVHIAPPAYSHLPEQPWAPMGPQVRALTGSTVTLRGRTDRSYAQGQVRLGTAPPEPWRPAADGFWQVQTVLQQTVDVSVLFINGRGVGLIDPNPRTLVAVPDAPPTAAVLEPQGDIELKDHEQFVLHWRATDDLGLGAIALHIDKNDGSAATVLPLQAATVAPQGSAEGPWGGRGVQAFGSITLGAGMLGLTPRQEILVTVQATDTAAQSSTSGPLRVRLFSALQHHEELLNRQAEVQNALVDWLALELNLRAGPRDGAPLSPLTALVAQVVSVHGALSHLARAFTDDTLSNDGERLAIGHIAAHAERAQNALQRDAATLGQQSFAAQRDLWRAPHSSHGARIHTLEADILYLDDLLAHGRLDVLQEHVKDLLAAKAELQDLIARYRQTEDPTLKAQLASRMAALKQQVQSLLQKMAALKPALPEGFFNSEASAQDPWGSTMQRLDDAMEQGDVDAVARDLEHLANMVDNAAQELQQKQSDQEQAASQALRQQLQTLADNVQRLERRQEQLQQQGQKLAQEALERAAGPADDSLRRLLEGVQQQLASAERDGREALPLLADRQGAYQALSHGLEALQQTRALLDQTALPAAAERLRQSSALMAPVLRDATQGRRWSPKEPMAVDERRIRRHLSSAQSAMQRAQNTLDDLLDKAAGALPPKLQQQAQQLQQAQRELAQEAERAQQAAAAMQEQGPVVGAEAAEQLGEAGEAMGEAAQAFAQGRPGPGHQQQNAALDALKKMQQSLQQAMQPGGAGGAGGMPMPMGKRRPGPPPGSGTSPGSHNDAEVAIPKGDLPNNAWREQLLDHAKQPPPLHYEEAVRRYYDELMR